MKDKYFIDTNIIVYTFDKKSKLKRKMAAKLVQNALKDGRGIISYQVIQEFLNVATRKFKVPLSPLDCQLYIKEVLLPICEVYPGPDFFVKALTIKEETGFSFYDSLIVTGAIVSSCKIIFSEDLQSGRTISNTTIINPFIV